MRTAESRRLRVLLLINSLGVGGAEEWVLDLSRAIDPKKVACSLVTLCPLDSRARASRQLDGAHRSLNVTSVADLQKGVERLHALLLNDRPDILHTHLVQASVVGRLASARLRPVHLVHLISTQHHAFHPKEESELYRQERFSRDENAAIIASSRAIAAYLRQDGYSGTIKLVPTGVDARVLAARAQAVARPIAGPYLVSVGHFRDRHKGHDILIDALPVIVRQFPDVRCVFVGKGELLSEHSQRAQRLGVGQNAIFLGERTDVPSLILGSEALVLASRWEGFGRVLIEAMALAKPVVATRVEAIPEVVGEAGAGVLIPPDDAEALSTAASWLLSSREIRLRMGHVGRERVESQFRLDRMAARVSRVYEAVVATDQEEQC